MALPRPRRRPGGRVARQVKCPPPGAAVARHRVAVPASAVSRTPAVAPAVAVAATTRAAAMVVVVVVATPAAAGVAIVGVVATPAAGVARRAAAGAHRAVAADITKSWYFIITVTYSGVRDSGFGIRGGGLRFGNLFCEPRTPNPEPRVHRHRICEMYHLGVAHRRLLGWLPSHESEHVLIKSIAKTPTFC